MKVRDPASAFALLTARGAGAIAVTAVCGPLAGSAIARHFRLFHDQPFEPFPVETIRYGRWMETGYSLSGAIAQQTASCDLAAERDHSEPFNLPVVGEDLLLCRTGTESFELQSHGGFVSAQRIARDLAAAGLTELTWEELLRWQKPWYIAEPLIEQQRAPTDRLAFLTARQGRLWQDFAARVRSGDAPQHDRLKAELQSMAENSRQGTDLLRVRKIVLFGPPNAGKSSMLNRLAGFDRSLVHAQPGTTRDIVSQLTAIDGWPVEIHDTAGMRETGEEVERAGVERANAATGSADIRIMVLDRASPPSPSDLDRFLELKPHLTVWNKSDLAPVAPVAAHELTVSALTGTGVAGLLQAASDLLNQQTPNPLTPVPLNDRMTGFTWEALNLARENDWKALEQMFCETANDL